MQLPNGSSGPWRRTNIKKSKTGEDGSNHTAQVDPCRQRKKEDQKKEWIWFGFDFGLRISFKKQTFSRNEFACPVMGTIFLVILMKCPLTPWTAAEQAAVPVTQRTSPTQSSV